MINVSPRSSFSDIADVLLGTVMLSCQIPSFLAIPSCLNNLQNLQFCEFVLAVFFSYSQTMAIYSILSVVCLSSNPQMFWITTRRVIARVKNVKAVGDWANKQFISKTVSCYSIFGGFCNPPVTTVISATVPYPALFASGLFFDMIKQSFFDWNRLFTISLGRLNAWPTAKAIFPDFQTTRLSVERLVAEFA